MNILAKKLWQPAEVFLLERLKIFLNFKKIKSPFASDKIVIQKDFFISSILSYVKDFSFVFIFFLQYISELILSKIGANGGNRTHTVSHTPLKRARLPVPPHSQICTIR